MTYMRTVFVITVFMVLMFCTSAALADVCLDCHKDVTPGVTSRWQASAHASAGIGCTGCHGENVKANHDRRTSAQPGRCGACHKKTVEQWSRSGHSGADDAGAMCSGCHSMHGTGPMLPARPEVCARCHARGEQYEAWLYSPHGAAYLSGGRDQGPDCVFCHMPGGTHDVSNGLSSKRPGDTRDAARKVMLDVCVACHPPAPAKRALEAADQSYSSGRAAVDEAHDILNVLWKEGLIDAAPPDDASALVSRGTLSRTDALFLQIWDEAYRSSQRSFHFGGGGKALEYDELVAMLKGESKFLREVSALKKRLEHAAAIPAEKYVSPEELKSRLRELKRRVDTGNITPAQYRSQRDTLLDNAGL